MQDGNEGRQSAHLSILEFIREHRKPIYATAAVLAAVMVASVATLIIVDFTRGRAIEAVEELAARRDAIPENGGEAELDVLVGDIRAFAARRSGYSGSRAWSMLASIYGGRGEWAEAEAAWLSAAGAAPKSHLAPIAFFNAAAAAEEQGRADDAIDFYRRSISAPSGFFAAPRAQFSIGRLHESLGDEDSAIRAYRELAVKWPYDVEWGNLARSRIIALETADSRLDGTVFRESTFDFPFAENG